MKYYCVYFVGSGLNYEQQFMVQAPSEVRAENELLRQNPGAHVRQVIEVQYNRLCSYAKVEEMKE